MYMRHNDKKWYIKGKWVRVMHPLAFYIIDSMEIFSILDSIIMLL